MNIIKPSLQKNGTPVPNNIPKFIILHHAEASVCSIYDINSWHLQNGWIMCGYHYFVRKDGSIYQGRKENEQGSHCPNYNTRSIGICAEGEYMRETMPEVQKQSIIELCKYVVSKYGIPNSNVVRHGDVYPTSCCGTNYPFKQIVSVIFNGVSSTITGSTSTVQNTSTSISTLDVQKALNRLHITDESGNRLVEDGISGVHTINTIKKFQSIVDLTSDGIAGKNTSSAINQILSKPVIGISRPTASIPTRYVQWWLGITVDGAYGSQTANAVKTWQQKMSLDADGILGNQSWSKLIG